jgi:anti-sigma regulatory factor (Ser/Thr protein kinase)
LKLSNTLTSRIILISDELNNNAIEYGTGAWWSNIMRIMVKKVNKDIYFNLEVEDDGKWREPKTVLEMETMRAHKLKIGYFNHNSVRWRWLFLIAVKIADRLYFKNSRNWWLIVGVKMKVNGRNI